MEKTAAEISSLYTKNILTRWVNCIKPCHICVSISLITYLAVIYINTGNDCKK